MTNSRWTDEWMRAWQSFPGTGDANPWTAALDHFTKSNPNAYQQPFVEELNRITEQSRAFFDLGQQIVGNEDDGWQQAVLKYLDDLSEQLRDPRSAAAVFAGASPLDYWRQFADQWAPASREPHSFHGQIEQLLRMPGLGYTRERQEFVQELSRRWLDYEKAYGEYAAYCVETARRTAEKLRERLREEFTDEEGPDSIRAVYDAWVACSEEVYAERTRTEEYIKLHGRLVNALMAYRQQAVEIMDQWAEVANLPTRTEVDALHRKLKDTREAVRDLQAREGTRRKTQRKKAPSGTKTRGKTKKKVQAKTKKKVRAKTKKKVRAKTMKTKRTKKQ
ncbi:MAG: Poly(3-hydroxyalkanoate) polymerase subunit PhaE [Gammaproteobacteria bacterium]|nr:Poly(3-hydroxyalkanoate) polymerase subunit PhaE [Gammaproteobacteria bacterium]